jgi:type II secretory pathway component PulF
MPAISFDKPLSSDSASAGIADASLTPGLGGELTWNSPDALEISNKKVRHGAIRPQDIAEFTSQFAIMSRSGIDVASALGSLASQCQRPALAQVLREVHESVLAGSTLSEAMRQQTHVFDRSFVATIAAGEASGEMSRVLRQLAQIQQSEMRSRRAMKSMMTYPILLISVASSVIVGLVLFVLPQFAQIFSQYEMSLPAVTQMLISLAAELRGRWWIWFPMFAITVTGLWTWRKTDQGRRSLDALWLHTPVIQQVCRTHLVGRTCQLLGLMLDSGVPLLDSLRLTREATDNRLYKELLAESEEAVINGRSLASVWQHSDIIPQSAREMMITAESTGNLGEVSQLLGEYYDEEAQGRMRQLVGLLEPVITVVMGAIVAVIVLAVMLPVFDLSTLSQKGH